MARKLKIRDFKTCLNFASGGNNRVDCGSELIGTGAVTVTAWINPRGLGESSSGRFISTGTGGFFMSLIAPLTFRVSSNDSTIATAASNIIKFNEWQFVAVTRDATGVANLYYQGALSGTANQSSGTPVAGASNLTIGSNPPSFTRDFNGKMDNVRVFNRVLTATEIATLYYEGGVPTDFATSMIAEYLFDEGAGTTANDTSGRGNTGTITTATFSGEVVMKPRKIVNYNLVENGYLEFAPPFVAVGTTTSKWIDGTASGSAANDLFKWAQVIDASSCNVSFDSAVTHSGGYSIKVDSLDATGRGRAVQGNGSGGTGASLNPLTMEKYAAKVLPSTSYTLTYYIKTVNALTGSHRIAVHQHDGTGTRLTTNSGTNVTGTKDWQQITLTFTTEATTRYILFNAEITTAGEIKTVWFDDIEFKPTTAIARTLVSTTPRFEVRDFGTALSFDGVNDSASVTSIPLASVTGITSYALSFWIAPGPSTITREIVTCRTGENHFLARMAGNRFDYFDWTAAGNQTQLTSAPTSIKIGEWNHCVIMRNGTALTMRVNNVLVDSDTTTADPLVWTSSTIIFGANNIASSAFYVGRLDQTRFYTRVLTAAEIENLYYNGPVPSGSLVGEWLLDEGSGTTILDSSGNGSNGTINGATYTTQVRMIARTLIS